MKKKIANVTTMIFIMIFLLSSVPIPGKANSPTDEVPPVNVFLPVIFNGSGVMTEIIGDVSVTVDSPVMPDELIASEPDDAIQVASAYSLDPFEEISINSVAYGETSPLELLPSAVPGGAAMYRSELENFRSSQGGTPTPGPIAHIFDQVITSSYSIVQLSITSGGNKPYLIVEWVVEALEHLWIIRVSRDVSDGTDVDNYLSILENIEISGELLDSKAINDSIIKDDFSILSHTLDNPNSLEEPPWWNGDVCDSQHFYEETGLESSPLGYSYDGLVACGPRPYESKNARVHFFDGDNHGALEFECVELAMRYLYLKYDVAPYGGHGRDIVNNFPISQYPGFEIIWQNNAKQAPQPGDVISFAGPTSVGHVAIVTYSDVHSNGDGYIEIIEQNSPSDGHELIIVDDWILRDSISAINWLHDSSENGDYLFTNSDFEENLGWEFYDNGEYWEGGYSDSWSSHGTRSYLIMIPTDDTGCYAYPGENTYGMVSQEVNLTNIRKIYFDFKTFGSWDVPGLGPDYYHSFEVWIDNSMLYSRERQIGEFFNQSISVEDFAGEHTISFRMQGFANFCSTCNRGVYLDNIRAVSD